MFFCVIYVVNQFVTDDTFFFMIFFFIHGVLTVMFFGDAAVVSQLVADDTFLVYDLSILFMYCWCLWLLSSFITCVLIILFALYFWWVVVILIFFYLQGFSSK
jgi:hypothetical protein